MKFLSLIFLLVIFCSALFAPFFLDYNVYEISLSESFKGPSWSHPFGLDENGRGLFSQVLYGSRISLFVTCSVVIISFLIGLTLGTLAAYLEGTVERIIMSLADLVLAFPKFLMALALVAILGGSVSHLVFALSFSTWAGFARLIRGEVKYLKKKEFVLQAQGSGASSFFLIRKHILPGLFGLAAVHAVFQAAAVLIAESGLSFLGLGASLENPSWGALLGVGRNYIFSAPHIVFFPALVLFLFLLSLNYLGESLRDSFDPHRSSS